MLIVGVLIALQVNNWNEQRQATDEYHTILRAIQNDLAQDTVQCNKAIAFYEWVDDFVYDAINNELAEDVYEDCDSCAFIVLGDAIFDMTRYGFHQLEGFMTSNATVNRALVEEIVVFYSNTTAYLDHYNSRIADCGRDALAHWRDNYPWFTNRYINEQPNPEAIQYMLHDEDYKRWLAYYQEYCYYLHKGNVDYKHKAIELIGHIEKTCPPLE